MLKCSSVGNWSSFCCAGAISDAVLTAGIVKSATLGMGGALHAPSVATALSLVAATSFKQFRMILRNILKKLQAPSFKQQAIDMKEIIGYKIVNKGETNERKIY